MSTTGLRHRVEICLPLPFLALLYADLVVSIPRVPHVKVATSPPVVRELYLRPIGDDDPVQERRAKLIGLDEPAKHSIDVITEETVDAEIKRLEQKLGPYDRSVEAGAVCGGAGQ